MISDLQAALLYSFVDIDRQPRDAYYTYAAMEAPY